MNKSLTSLLSATLLLGSAFQTEAAPLAKRASGKVPGAALSAMAEAPAEATQTNLGSALRLASPRKGTMEMLLSASRMKDLSKIESPTASRRNLAAKSATAAGRRGVSAGLDLRGCIIYPGSLAGFVTVPTTDGGEFTALGDDVVAINGGGYDNGEGTYYGLNYESDGQYVTAVTLYTIDTETMNVTNAKSLYALDLVAYDVAMDPTTGIPYGIYYGSGESMVWGKGDYVNASVETIKELSDDEVLMAVGCDATGQFYGWSKNNKFVKIDKATGAQTLIATTNCPYQYLISGCVDSKAGKFILAYNTDALGGGLYEIDLATGESAPLVNFNNDIELTSLYVVDSNTSEKSPAAPQLTLSAPEGTMTVDFTITLPETLLDGTPVTGSLNWNISVGGEVKFEGRNMAGTSVSDKITLTETGLVEFVAVASNSDGVSPKTKAEIFVGKGCPAAPQNVKLAYADGNMTLIWAPVTGSSDGGYVNPAEVTYDIIDGSHFIAKDLTATTHTWAVEAPATRTDFKYMVIAKYNDTMSEMGESNTVSLGAYPTPYTRNFRGNGTKWPEGYTVINVNNDNRTWEANNSGMRYRNNSKEDADDWFISPDIYLEAGKVYPVTVRSYGSAKVSEDLLEVKAGQGVTVDAMTIDICGPTLINVTSSLNPVVLAGNIVTDAAGNYNVGVHACSPKDQYNMYIIDITVGEGLFKDAPQPVADLTVTPEATGLKEATVAFTLPALNVLDEAISGSVAYTVLRGEDEVKSGSGNAGAKVSFKDVVPANGDYTYTVVCSVNSHEGNAASVSQYVGPSEPAATTSVQIFETYQPGTVTLVWTPVAADVKGNPIKAENVSYMVYDANGMPMLSEPTSKATATFQALSDVTVQKFCQYFVTTFNRDRESTSGTASNMIPVGPAYEMPVNWSNVDDLADHIFGINSAGGAEFGVYDAEQVGIPAADADNTLLVSIGQYLNQTADFFTGKIDLTATERPEVVFHTYKISDDDSNLVEVYVLHDNEETLVHTASHADMESEAWTRVAVDLSKFNGKNVQVLFRTVITSMGGTAIDAISIRETPDKDLAAVSILAPAVVEAGKPFDVNVLVGNYGYLTAENFVVNLYRNGDLCATRNVSKLEPAEEIAVLFENVVSMFDDDNTEAVFVAEVLLDGDKDVFNNATDEIVVKRPASTLPVVEDLTVAGTDEGNKLTWTKFDAGEGVALTVTENFESAEPFAQEFGNWTFVDVDQQATGGLQGVDIPGFTLEQKLAYMVFDAAGMEGTFAAKSGTKYLAAFFNYYGDANDDWAISPVLCGEAQTVSFFARSYAGNYAETFEMLYTTEESVDPKDYKSLGVEQNIPQAWTEYKYELPEGALHFAIRHISKDKFFLFVDDVTMKLSAQYSVLHLVGYDIYRDGEKINEEPVDAGEYLDTEAPAGKHVYHVVARYEEGASELSNPAEIENSGLADVLAGALGVAVDGSDIVVSGAEGMAVTVAAVDGKVLYKGVGDARVTVAPAIYLVAVDGKTFKLIVK